MGARERLLTLAAPDREADLLVSLRSCGADGLRVQKEVDL
jgi:hypothetical protein